MEDHSLGYGVYRSVMPESFYNVLYESGGITKLDSQFTAMSTNPDSICYGNEISILW